MHWRGSRGCYATDMFEEPDHESNQEPVKRSVDPDQRAREKADEFRMFAELAAVFEGSRKFDAEIMAGLDAEVAREMQRSIGKLEKAKTPDTPVLPSASAADAVAVLTMSQARELSTNDYHIHRRPGEVIILRWLEADQVETIL